MRFRKSNVGSNSDDVEILRKELEKVLAQNSHLKEQLLASQSSSIQMHGALYKYKTYPVGLFNSPWVEGYFTLYGSCLKYFRSDKDVALKPHAMIEIAGSTIEWEGLKQGRYWTFSLLDSAGCCLIRLSSENRAVVEKWIEALSEAGADAELVPALLGKANATHGHTHPVIGSFEELVNTNTDEKDNSVSHSGSVKRRRHDRKEHTHENKSLTAKPRTLERRKSRTHSPMVGSTPLHKQQTSSILSSEKIASLPQPGLVNLGAVVLLASNFRLILENMINYGVLFNPLLWVEQFFVGAFQPLMLCWPILASCALAALYLEVLAARRVEKEISNRHGKYKRSASAKKSSVVKHSSDSEEEAVVPVSCEMYRFNRLCTICQGFITLTCLLVPLYFVHISEGAIPPCFAVTMFILVIWMKLVSFAHCNYDLRQARLAGEIRPGERESATPIEGADQPLQYPENLTFGNMLYFLVAPTLTYQLTFPRTGRIRFRWLGRRCIELVVMVALLMAIVDQYIFPAVRNSVDTIRDRKTGHYLERVLKLSIPVVYSWLCMFYILFHVWLNILAEVIRFGDREFYKDWWNASNVGEYWRLWNIPVHKWMLRTVYYPALNLGIGRNMAMLLVFFVSAVFHEIAVAVPLKLTRIFPWSFMGILGQVPMVFISQKIQMKFGDRFGNVFFWVSFCVLGQPICIMSYYYDWVQKAAQMY